MMKRINPYYLSILALAMVGLLFSKINKQDFYHHYFKVIEEVGDRNSQAVEKSDNLASLTFGKLVQTISQQFSITSHSLFSKYQSLLTPSLLTSPTFRTTIFPLLSQRVCIRLCPIHAP